MKNGDDARNRAWNLIKVAILWGRKGGAFKRRLMMDLRGVIPKYLKTIRNRDKDRVPYYGEHQLSFDKTPVFHVKMVRPASMRCLIPCVTPLVDYDFDYDFEEKGSVNYDYNSYSYDGDDCSEECAVSEKDDEDEEGIDVRAEKFIAKFYEEIRGERRITYIQCNDSKITN